MAKVKPEDSIRRLAKSAILGGVRHVNDIVQGTAAEANEPWNDRTTRTHVALVMAGHHQQNERAKVEKEGVKVVAPIFLFPQLAVDKWEAMAAEISATGALPPMDERRSLDAIEVETVEVKK